MPQEVRHVVFNEREVCEMVFGLLAARGDRREMTQPRVDIADEATGPRVTLRYVDRTASGGGSLELSSRDSLAAAVLFLRSRRVPMPMKADKRLAKVGGQLALVMTS